MALSSRFGGKLRHFGRQNLSKTRDETGSRQRDGAVVGATYGVEVTHPDIAPLEFLVGTWRGRGRGDYPTIDGFDYVEEISFSTMPKPFLAYQQRTTRADDGQPLHAETGYVRPVQDGPELVISQPTGIVEAHRGRLEEQQIIWDSHRVAMTPTAESHRVTKVRRELRVEGDELRYELHMGAVGQPLQLHLRATLHRVEA